VCCILTRAGEKSLFHYVYRIPVLTRKGGD
jgi:hypothetical protein